eukprot:scaffold122442_cov69-Phaeocystis_antarctica.AAC.5
MRVPPRRARTHQTHTACAHKRSFRRRGLGGLRTFQQRVGRLHDVFAGLEKVRAARLHAQLHGERLGDVLRLPQWDEGVVVAVEHANVAAGVPLHRIPLPRPSRRRVVARRPL